MCVETTGHPAPRFVHFDAGSSADAQGNDVTCAPHVRPHVVHEAGEFQESPAVARSTSAAGGWRPTTTNLAFGRTAQPGPPIQEVLMPSMFAIQSIEPVNTTVAGSEGSSAGVAE
jgi:hypothetical protein